LEVRLGVMSSSRYSAGYAAIGYLFILKQNERLALSL
jgi:hypothetical protein